MSAEEQPPGFPFEFQRPLRLDRLRRDAVHDFDITPDEAERAAIQALLGLQGLRKMRFSGQLKPFEREGWTLTGTLGASVTQPCVATLAPVRSRLDVPVRRRYLAQMEELMLSEEVEITAETSDEVEPLTSQIDLGALAVGELALALPPYPRAEDAPEQDTIHGDAAEPDTHRPFAGLAALKEKMQEGGDEG